MRSKSKRDPMLTVLVAASAIIWTSAIALSASGLVHLGEMWGYGALSFLLPVIVDTGAAVLAGLRAKAHNVRNWPTLAMLTGLVLLSAGGNVVASGNAGHAVPPIVAALFLEVVIWQMDKINHPTAKRSKRK